MENYEKSSETLAELNTRLDSLDRQISQLQSDRQRLLDSRAEMLSPYKVNDVIKLKPQHRVTCMDPFFANNREYVILRIVGISVFNQIHQYEWIVGVEGSEETRLIGFYKTEQFESIVVPD